MGRKTSVAVPEPLRAAIGGHPLVAQTLARRGLVDIPSAQAFLEPERYSPTPANELPGLQGATERLLQALQAGETICVWGDFDVDGQTATTLLVAALRALGAQVFHHIPVRAAESHGITLPKLEEAIAHGAQLILTCDTGVTAHEAVAFARQRGVPVIITDHHDPPPDLPDAQAVVNPKLLPAGHPLISLPGVGVAYKLVEALFEAAGPPFEAAGYLDLVALGIVADIAHQTGDTRYLLQRGLEQLRQASRLGLQVLMELAELNPAWLTEEHISFVLGPRLNALGRLGDANPVVEFLTTTDLVSARVFAQQLEGLNARRKLLTEQVYQGAQAQIEADPSLLEFAALVLAHPAWPAGVIGIVASRLVELYSKPTILLTTPPGELARGSARSVEGVNITAAIAAQEDLLAGFGGHPMAAGLALDPQHIPAFRQRLSKTIQEMQAEAPVVDALTVDAYVELSDLTLALVTELERLAPFGPGNPALILASRGLKLANHSTIGRHAEHRVLTVEDQAGSVQRVLWWQGANYELPAALTSGSRFDLAFRVRASTFNGQRDVQVEWVDAQIPDEAAVEIPAPRPKIEVIDYRATVHPLPLLQPWLEQANARVWGEGEAQEKLAAHNRYQLSPAKTLVIWTSPPGPGELAQALKKVEPEKLVLFGIPPQQSDLKGFLKRLAGLIKFALRTKDGRASLEDLAAASAQRETTVLAGVEWLVARGHLRLINYEAGSFWFAPGEGKQAATLSEDTQALQFLLNETAAYRQHFARADKETFVSLATDENSE